MFRSMVGSELVSMNAREMRETLGHQVSTLLGCGLDVS
jgi:hypothetical protein